MQQELIAGDSLNFLTTLPEYPAGAGWVLKYRLAPATAGGTAIDLQATAEGDAYRIATAAATTATWSADRHTWSAWVEKAGEVYTVDSGQILIKPNPRTLAAGYDGRSLAHKALDDAKAALAAWKPTQRRYKVGEREMEFSSTADIIKLITYWEQQVKAEDVLAGRAEKVGRRIYSRI
ncbi:hypothetical protein [Methylibium sp.]|uniref:hypothetical protein n=1 Tax=Methylibium sp. TaxID=2067992 RepID=UPI003D0AD418